MRAVQEFRQPPLSGIPEAVELLRSDAARAQGVRRHRRHTAARQRLEARRGPGRGGRQRSCRRARRCAAARELPLPVALIAHSPFGAAQTPPAPFSTTSQQRSPLEHAPTRPACPPRCRCAGAASARMRRHHVDAFAPGRAYESWRRWTRPRSGFGGEPEAWHSRSPRASRWVEFPAPGGRARGPATGPTTTCAESVAGRRTQHQRGRAGRPSAAVREEAHVRLSRAAVQRRSAPRGSPRPPRACCSRWSQTRRKSPCARVARAGSGRQPPSSSPGRSSVPGPPCGMSSPVRPVVDRRSRRRSTPDAREQAPLHGGRKR
jgi:hypothetical protein